MVDIKKKAYSKIYTERYSPIIAKTILTKKNKVRGIISPNSNTYYITIIIKTVVEGRVINQYNGTDNPEVYPCKYAQCFLKKGIKAMQWKNDSLFKKWCWNK